MRLFIAIELTEEMKKTLIVCMHDLKKQGVEGNYVPAQNLHMTLAFIGEFNEPSKVMEVVKSVPLPEIRLMISDKGMFGNILWVGAKGNQRLKGYVKDLRSALKDAGIPFDEKAFVPHITLIRKASAKKAYRMNIPKCGMTVNKVSLIKSVQKDGKTVYRTIFQRTV